MRSVFSGLLLVAAGTASAQATWVVEQKPILDIPGMTSSGTVNFGYAAGGIRLANGGLLIADRIENTIRVFDATGRLERSIGRAGGGPDEFQSMMWVGRCGGDSLMVWDLSRRQASLVGAGSNSFRQFRVPSGDTAQSPYQFSCSSRGAMVYGSTPRPARGGGRSSENPNIVGVNAAIYAVARDGTIRHRYGDVPAGEVVLSVSPSGGRGAIPRPLGRTAHVAALNGGIVISSADSAVLTFVDADQRSSDHAIPVTTRPPTQAEFEASIDALASMAPPSARQAMIAQMRLVPIPARLPPVSALFVDTEDLVWVQTTPPGARAMDFLVLRPTGGVVARVHIPRGLTVFDIGRDYILGGYADSSDEMHVAVYRLRRQ